MLVGIFAVVMLGSVLLAVWAGRTGRHDGISGFLVGGRAFPAWLIYFLAVGEVYSIGTMIGLPSGIYAEGASHGIWFVGYILLAYVLGYFLAPLVWRAGHRHDAMTVPDVFGRHFGSRNVELVTCITLLIALVPWGQYQFIGMQVVLSGLGMPLSPLQCVLIAGVTAFVYIAVSGIRSPAFVSILKDTFMLVGVIAVGVAAVCSAGGVGEVTGPAALSQGSVTMRGSNLTFAMTTILFQGVVFYFGFGTAYIFPARSERAVKSSTVWMPLYMLMYPFLVFAAYYGIQRHPDVDDPNTIFMVTARGLLPEWLLGVVAAAAGLAGVLVLAATALVIGGMVTRNLVPYVRPTAQRRWTTVMVAAFLVLAAVLTLYAATLMLTVLNLTYMLLAQVVPGWLAVLYVRRTNTTALSLGMITGVLVAVALYVLIGENLAGINTGLLSLGTNLLVTIGGSALRPGTRRNPIAFGRGPQDRSDNTVASVEAT